MVGQRMWFPFEVQGIDGVVDALVEDVCVGEGLIPAAIVSDSEGIPRAFKF